MKRIPLTQGLVALVDDEDYDRVMAAGKWHAHRGRVTFYAARTFRRTDGKKLLVRLHAFITGWERTDHHNGDGLDNRRANLREATAVQNNANQRMRSTNTSGFKGVWRGPGGKWATQIRVNGRRVSLGLHETPEAAAKVYDDAAREAFGEFACLNFPRAGERSARRRPSETKGVAA